MPTVDRPSDQDTVDDNTALEAMFTGGKIAYCNEIHRLFFVRRPLQTERVL